jgi:hypothetical protein
MKTLVSFGAASVLILGVAGTAVAQTDLYQDPAKCRTNVVNLDINHDGYVDTAEAADHINIDTKVDVNGDGRISKDEMVVACDKKMVRALSASK